MNNIFQLTKYSLVSIMSAISDWIFFTIVVYLGIHVISAQAGARIFGGMTSFFLSRHWTFSKTKKKIFIQTRRFIFLYVLSYVLSLTSIYFFIEKIGISIFLSKAISDVICFLFNFLIMKVYVFSNSKGILFFIKKLIS